MLLRSCSEIAENPKSGRNYGQITKGLLVIDTSFSTEESPEFYT
ncbi:MAG: hypothetical protein ACI93L_001824, partial [Cyclobacteriaceae bacterium]